MLKPGLAVVISSPSGTGKTTICHKLVQKHSDFQYSVSATTRLPRKNERNGVDYYFMPPEKFQEDVKSGKFIESAKYLGHYYGTPLKPVRKSVSEGKVILLDIDIQGGRLINKKLPDSVLIFIVPPSLTELKKRLKRRLTESADARNKRFEKAVTELKNWSRYDYIVVNDNLETAVSEISSIIMIERLKTSRLADKRYWKKSLVKLLGLSGTRR